MTDRNFLSDVVVREARHKDYQDVMAIITNIFEGQDELSALYHLYLEDPKRFLFVAELHGEIIGFDMQFVVDDGATAIRQSSRVKMKYQGKHVISKIVRYGVTKVHQKYPKVESWAAASENDQEMKAKRSSSYIKVFDHRAGTQVRFQNNFSLKSAVSSQRFQLHAASSTPTNTTYQLSAMQALQTLDSLTDNKAILPEHAWVVNYEPFKPMHCNYETILHGNTAGTAVVMVTKDDKHNVMALSFGTVTDVSVGVVLRVDYYCHEKERETNCGSWMLNSHLARHLVLLEQNTNSGEIIIDVFVPKEMNKDAVLSCYRLLGLGHFEEVSIWTMYFFEAKLKDPTKSKL